MLRHIFQQGAVCSQKITKQRELAMGSAACDARVPLEDQALIREA